MHQADPGKLLQAALSHHSAGRLTEAEGLYGEILSQQPDHSDALHLLGVLETQKGRLETAVELMERAIAINPTMAEYHGNLGEAYLRLEKPEQAVACFERAIEIKPAIQVCERVLSIKPDYAEGHNELGNAFRLQGRLDQALASYEKAVALKPDFADAQGNLGVTLTDVGRFVEAIAACNRAISIAPDFADGHLNLGLAHLALGKFDQGLPEYEWRLRLKKNRPAKFDQPQWDGDDLKGRTILLYAEQGLGDTIQFARYAPLVSARGGRVILEVQPELQRLLESLPGVEQVIPRGQALPPFDLRCPLLSLPLALNTKVETIPASIPYLQADPQLVEVWLVDFSDELTDFSQTAALMMNLDLILSTCTAVSHLAGAIGRPLWIMLPFNCDWRWMVDRLDSPWYPTARLWRQKSPGAWDEVIQRVAESLSSAATSAQH